MSRIRNTFALFATVFTLASTLSFSAAAAERKPKNDDSAAIDTANLVWPQPPQRRRIAFVTQITGVDDVKGARKRTWMDRAAGAKQKEPRTRLKTPYGVASDSKGRIFVADPTNRSIFVFDIEHREVSFRGDKAPAQLALPIGVAIDARDRLFVSDSYFHQITLFGPEGEVVAVFGSNELQRPGGIAIDNTSKRLYVADSKANNIAVFDSESLRLIGHVGAADTPGEQEKGRFSCPTNVAVSRTGEIYVTDTWNSRVQVFDGTGKFMREFGGHGVVPGSFVRPKGVAVDVDGHVYVADAEFNNFQILSSKGEPMLAIGAYGNNPGQFALIAGIAIDNNNRIYVTDQLRGRVQVFQYYPEAMTTASNQAPNNK
jgi:DNA-binding beta-propeller fold protein YncE